MSSEYRAEARRRLILALDVDDAAQARSLIEELSDLVGVFKVGLELFGNCGPDLLGDLSRSGRKVFFDGKLLDIPNTVAGASRACARRGVYMFNVHATGGLKMMRAARLAADEAAAAAGVGRPLVVAVTVLTSIGQETLEKELGVSRSLADQVASLALLARESGLDGVVCSANEVERLREVCGRHFLLVTPGVRPTWSSTDDQVRIVTPAEAMRLGSDYVVIGRPITAAPDRRQAAERVLAEMSEAIALKS